VVVDEPLLDVALAEAVPVPVVLAAALGALAEAVLVDDPLLDVALAEAVPVPVALAVAVLVGAPFVELLAEAEEAAVPVPLPLEDALVEEDVLVEAERANAKVETATIARASKRCFMGNVLWLTRVLGLGVGLWFQYTLQKCLSRGLAPGPLLLR